MEEKNIIKLIDLKIKFFKIIWSDFIEIHSKICFPEKFILKDIVNYFKQKLEELIRIDNYILIKLNQNNIEIYKRNKEIEIININEKLKEQLNNIPSNIINLDKSKFDEVYNLFKIDNIFGFITKNLYLKNIEGNYIILFNSNKKNNLKLYEFFTFSFCKKIQILITKSIEILLSVQLEINISILEIFREIFEDILLEIFENFSIINIFKIYELVKDTYNNLEIIDNYNKDNKNPFLCYKDGIILINNIESSFELNLFINKKLNDISKFQANYLILINNFKLWKNIDNYSIMFFNSKNILIYYNFINSNWFDIEIIKHEIWEISLDYNKSYNMTNKSLDLKGICKNNQFSDRVDSVINNMLNNNMNYFEISNPLMIFQIYKNGDFILGYSIMIKNSLNKNFSEESFWKKFNFVVEKNKFDNVSTIAKEKNNLLNVENNDKKHVRFDDIENSNPLNSNLFKRRNKKNVNFYENLVEDENYSKIDLSRSININAPPSENIDKSILMEFIPDKAKNTTTTKKDNLKKNRKSIFINHFNDKDLEDEFSKNIELRKSKYNDLLLNNLDNLVYAKENEILDFEKFLNNKPPIENITKLDTFDDFNTWNFDTLELNENELCKVAIDIMETKNWFGLFNIDKLEFFDFIWKCNFYYGRNKNYFHNFKHGITVAHSMNQLYKLKYIDLLLNDEQKFTWFISALGHDLDHRGKTNSFEINTISDLALNYHDKSPLEQHHCYILFKILSIENTNLFKQFTTEVYKNLREIIIVSILYTDMKCHFDLVSEIKLKLENNNLDKEKTDFLKLCGFTLHLADLNGPSKTFNISLEWSRLLNKEFIEQYDEEQKLNLPLTPHFKDLKNPITYHNNEYKFMKFLIIPLYEVFFNLVEEDTSFKNIFDNTFNNMNFHFELFTKYENEKNNKEN